ncbi:hypothetical protein CSA_021610 [Cucumis sativus]|uniref:Uncharacterized protein n=1 Tax=Cucumis sativus TaxID=3659 RepID=A0ACB6HC20_CUCSA|nr:hypothetical protein CSA_021610 [Cucumis sativus]
METPMNFTGRHAAVLSNGRLNPASPETITASATHQLTLPPQHHRPSKLKPPPLFPISPILQILFTRLLEPSPTLAVRPIRASLVLWLLPSPLPNRKSPASPSAGNYPNRITPLTWTLCLAGRFPVGSRFRRSDIQFRRRRRRSRRTNRLPVRQVIPNGQVLGYFDWALRDVAAHLAGFSYKTP